MYTFLDCIYTCIYKFVWIYPFIIFFFWGGGGLYAPYIIIPASTHKLFYNGSKSFALYFKKNSLKVRSPPFYLDPMKIPTVDQWPMTNGSLCSAHCSVYSKLWAWWNILLHI